jgi:hypothetical protein
MKNNLQSYFDTAKNVRNQQPMLSNDEIFSLIEHVSPIATPNRSTKPLALLSLIALVTLGGAAALVNYLYFSVTNTPQAIPHQSQAIPHQSIAAKIPEQQVEQPKPIIETPPNTEKEYTSKKSAKNPSNNTSNSESHGIQSKSLPAAKDIEGLKVIELSENEALVLAAHYPKLYAWLHKNYSVTDTCDITLTPMSAARENTVQELHSVVFLKIRRENAVQTSQSDEFILWFTPTIEFADALPERYKTPFQSELNARAEIVANCLPAERACKAMRGSSPFFDLCRRESGALSSVTISPNPASESAECTFMLQNPRDIYVSLHEVNGRFVKTMIQNEPKAIGEQKVPLLLQGIPAGAYLVAAANKLLFN